MSVPHWNDAVVVIVVVRHGERLRASLVHLACATNVGSEVLNPGAERVDLSNTHLLLTVDLALSDTLFSQLMRHKVSGL